MPFDINLLPLSIRPTVVRLQETIAFSDNITKGANGYVLIGLNRLLNRMQVVKFYYWGGGLHIEPALLATLESQHVLRVDSAEAVDEEDAYFITRYCEGGDLDDQLRTRTFGPLQAIDTLLQIASGVSYLHGQGYLHRDLKPSNILCAEDSWVIGDFGSVVLMNNDGFASTQSKHSIIYRPPEDFLANTRYYRQGDVYQLSIVFYQLLGGKLSYEVDDWLTTAEINHRGKLDDIEGQIFAQTCIQRRIERGKVIDFRSLPAIVPDHIVRLIRAACRTDYLRRPSTVADLITRLNNLRKRTLDWRIVDGLFQITNGGRSFRIVPDGQSWRVQKMVQAGWKNQNDLARLAIHEAVKVVENLVR
ncbi:serine/threonine protein kinase [Ochrobactrum chromiisoli]|uniref:non-specific serine/threonine protein kinase n=1 Tax=Ochrobactrum chromiisoli TaxID=2993941 RepID=A0ABT3QRW8_9HYPH|nr:protein kinase [Ochrobactrum chromiisoli]MCX2698339.1 protein kinase [Ochrobactrum chromiisoli]